MRKTREILRLRWDAKLSQRSVAQSCNCAPSTVHEVETRATEAKLCWPLPDDLDDASLEARLYPKEASRPARPEPDFRMIHLEVARPGVTLALLWQEYRAQHPDGLGYTTFCQHYRQWRKGLETSMRLPHAPGEKLYVDFAGQRPTVFDPGTGEARQVSVFVSALGASQFIYAEAVQREDLPSWLRAHEHALEFLGGVPQVVVPDNLKAAVTKPCFYDPDLNRSYKDLADHYGFVVLPARVSRPKDKAKVENAVLQVERWVLAPLRNQKFFSLEELNRAIRERLDWLNGRVLTGLDKSRRELFDSADKPALQSLPRRRFQLPEWKRSAGVNIDYHVEFQRHYYSVPSRLIGKRVDIRATSTTLECFYQGQRVAAHPRSHEPGKHTTLAEHRPQTHRHYAEWTPSRLIRWASSVGPQTAAAVESVIGSKRHPEEGYRSALGIIRLGSRFGKERLEKACERALQLRSAHYRTIHSMLKNKMEEHPLPASVPASALIPDHENVRGANYYQ